MAHLYWLSDKAWAQIEPHLPHGRPGRPRVDDRRVISGILYVLKTGCRWRDVPPAYGPATTIYNRYNRWSRRGLWQRLFQRMASMDPSRPSLRSTAPTSKPSAPLLAAGGRMVPGDRPQARRPHVEGPSPGR